MSEPIKKPERENPEGYSPKKPKIVNMAEEFKDNAEKQAETEAGLTEKEPPTKNSLDFNIRYNSLEGLTFIQRFTAVYMFLENIDGSGGIYCENGNPCSGCGGGNCGTPTAVNKQASYFFLFNTMSGNSALRCHFDRKPTEMQKVIGDINLDCKIVYGNDCGSDFTVDFLFGYAGYEYRKCTDTNAFKKEIITSINAGKPVIVKTKSGDVRFYVITGYDGDTLLCHDYNLVTYEMGKGNVLTEKPEEPPIYDELESVYIIGGKTARRYTVRDGLNNIRRVMECNINESVWDGYLKKLGGYGKFPSDDGLDKASPEDRKARVKRLSETVLYVYNFQSFCNSICVGIPETMRDDFLYKELFGPGLSEFWGTVKVISFWDDIAGAGHKFGAFYWNRDWLTVDHAEIPGISTEICEVIEKANQADIKLLEIINQAIEILDKKET